jgi:hypothetical protein
LLDDWLALPSHSSALLSDWSALLDDSSALLDGSSALPGRWLALLSGRL